MGHSHKDMLGAVQGGGAVVDAGWCKLGQCSSGSWAASTSAMGMCPTGMCQNLPLAPEYEVAVMKAGEGCLK